MVAALALWQLRLVVALLFLAFILAAAMRLAVESLARRGVRRAAGIGLHYVVLVGLIGVFLWAVVPRAIDQVDEGIETCLQPAPSSAGRRASRPGSSTTSSSDCSAASRTFPPARASSTRPSR